MFIPGIFWFVTSRKDWPTPLSLRMRLRTIRLAVVVLSVLLCGVSASLALFSLSLPWFPLNGDCGGNSLLDDDGQPRGKDFTARIVFVPPRFLALRFYNRTLWAMGRVEKRFSGASSIPGTVILRGDFTPDDSSKQYFVEGKQHPRTLLSRFLPIVEPVWCGHTRLLDQAQLELRVLA
jgi:hypothetical protein